MGYKNIDGKWVRIDDPIPTEKWIIPYKYRIVVPKTTIIEYPDLLIFKSYGDLMGLPIETDDMNVYMYCNEIYVQHQQIIDRYKLIVEEK